jgi:5-methylcytosine-specific restriction endonuclease McrA
MEIKSKEHYQNLIKGLSRQEAYQIYIASPNWKQKREQRLRLDRYECVACGETENLHVHHKYPKGYFNIPDEHVNDDLKTFCELCHMALHSSINERRYQDRDIEVQNHSEPREAQKELISYGLEESKIQINGRKPPDPSRWQFGESTKSDCERNEENFWQTKEDRSRFRGIG